MPDIHPPSDLLDLAYPYALDAVTDDERRAIERAVDAADESEAAAFRATVREIRQALTSMTVVDSVAPPPELEAAIDRAIDRGDEGRTAATVSTLPRARTRYLGWLAAAAVLVMVLVVGAGIMFERTAIQDPDTITAQEVISHGDAHSTTAPVAGGGTITVSASAELDAAAVSFDAVPAPPAGHTYQMWLLPSDGSPRSAGVLATLPDARTPMVTPLGSAKQVAMSIEPVGGSPQPTNPVVAVAVR